AARTGGARAARRVRLPAHRRAGAPGGGGRAGRRGGLCGGRRPAGGSRARPDRARLPDRRCGRDLDDFNTARKFLTQPTRAEWDPGTQVVIYDGSAPLTYDDSVEGTVEIGATVVATVDSDGVYTQAAPGT